MARPTTHKWLPFYVWFLFAGAVSAILPICRALNGLPESGGYIFLGVLLTTIRAVTWWGLFTRKLWGWYLNFGVLFAIPALKGLNVMMFSGRDYNGNYGPVILSTTILWIIYAVPNVVYFQKRKYLFDDGEGPYKTLFEKGWGFRVLDSHVVSDPSIGASPLPSRAVQAPVTIEADSLVENVSVQSDDCILNNDKWEDIAMVNLSDKSDEQFYEIAQKEFDAGDIAKGLMLKAEVATGGDAGKARLLYIRTRAQELANEEKSLAVLREAFSDAVKGEKSADKFLKRIEQFRADYPDNAKISELQAEFEYQRLEARIEEVYTDEYQPSVSFEKRLRMYDSFLAENPDHLKRHEIEQNRSKYEGELVKIRDRNAFYTITVKAEASIGRHEYQAASDLYRGYLNQYSEHAAEARKMIEETIPKLIKDEPARKRRVKRNFVMGVAIVAVVVFVFGYAVWESVKESRLSSGLYLYPTSSNDFWPLVERYSPGSREMSRTSDPVWVNYLDTVDKQTGFKNRQRAEVAVESNDPMALAAMFDECRRLSGGR